VPGLWAGALGGGAPEHRPSDRYRGDAGRFIVTWGPRPAVMALPPVPTPSRVSMVPVTFDRTARVSFPRNRVWIKYLRRGK
jgi:hypothetical protein